MASNTKLKFQVMKVLYAKAEKRRLVVAGILMLGWIALACRCYTCCKETGMETVPVIYRREEGFVPCIGDFNEDDGSYALE